MRIGQKVSTRNYWIQLFSVSTWKQFIGAGSSVTGFRKSRWSSVCKIQPGDYLLAYLTRVSRFAGVLEVTSAPYEDETPLFREELFPARVKVNPVIALTPESAIPVRELSSKLSMFRNLKTVYSWAGRFRSSPIRWLQPDAEEVVSALQRAAIAPAYRPVESSVSKRTLPPTKPRLRGE